MAYSKSTARTEQEWKAYRNWFVNPVDAVKDWFGTTPDPWQADMLNAIFRDKKDRAIAKSAHGVGKTALDAWVAWIFANCLENSRVVATAPVQAQLTDVLFPELALWHTKMPKRMQDEWMISAQHVRHRANPNTWFMVARTSNKPANLQGFHNRYIQIIGDEGSAIPENVFEVIEGALSEATDEEGNERIARLIITGNPNFTAGEMFNAFGRNKDLYHRVTVTGDPELLDDLGIEDGGFHPDHGKVYLSSRVKKKYVDTMAKKYGRDSAIFDVRVRGVFPRFSDDCVVPFEWAQRAQALLMPTYWDKHRDRVTVVVDPSRGGAAETVIGFFRTGICYRLDAHKTQTTLQVTKLVQEAVLSVVADGLMLEAVIIDEPGVGGGVIDECRAAGLPVIAYNGSLPMVKDQDPAEDIRLFQNRRARDWWNVRRKLELGQLPLLPDETLLAQLTSIRKKFMKTSEKICIESKQDLKDRLGKDASPDRADVIVMGAAPWYQPTARAGMVRPEDMEVGDDRPNMEPDEVQENWRDGM